MRRTPVSNFVIYLLVAMVVLSGAASFTYWMLKELDYLVLLYRVVSAGAVVVGLTILAGWHHWPRPGSRFWRY